jgi:transcriptional regulator with XRE-family HTH domain
MSQQLHEVIPTWDVADRMRKALRFSGVGVQEIADYLGVSRNTVSTWINGRIEPSKQTVRLWALRTGVPFEWLETGKTPTGPEPDEGLNVERARRDSNPQPSDPKVRRLLAAA